MANSRALAECKLNLLQTMEAELTPPAELPRVLRLAVESLHIDTVLDFLRDGEFDARIAEQFTTTHTADLLLSAQLAATPSWISNFPFDRRDFRFSTSFRYPLFGPHAVTARIRERNLVSESTALAAAMTHAPEVNMKILQSFTKKAVSSWLPTLRAYYSAGGSRAVINLLSPACKDELATTTISSVNPILREVDSMDERELVEIVLTHFKSVKASDMTALQTAFQSIAMKASRDFSPEHLASYLARCHRVLLDNAELVAGYDIKKLVSHIVLHLAPKEFADAVKTKKESFTSTAACIAGIRDTGLLFEDHANVQKFFEPPPKLPAAPTVQASALESGKHGKQRDSDLAIRG